MQSSLHVFEIARMPVFDSVLLNFNQTVMDTLCMLCIIGLGVNNALFIL